MQRFCWTAYGDREKGDRYFPRIGAWPNWIASRLAQLAGAGEVLTSGVLNCGGAAIYTKFGDIEDNAASKSDE